MGRRVEGDRARPALPVPGAGTKAAPRAALDTRVFGVVGEDRKALRAPGVARPERVVRAVAGRRTAVRAAGTPAVPPEGRRVGQPERVVRAAAGRRTTMRSRVWAGGRQDRAGGPVAPGMPVVGRPEGRTRPGHRGRAWAVTATRGPFPLAARRSPRQPRRSPSVASVTANKRKKPTVFPGVRREPILACRKRNAPCGDGAVRRVPEEVCHP